MSRDALAGARCSRALEGRRIGAALSCSLALGCTPALPGASASSPGVSAGADEAPAPASPHVTELVRRSALPLEISDNFQPSGLLLHEGHLLTVSDRHDDAVFELHVGGASVTLTRFASFTPPGDEPAPLDYEGLTAADGKLLVVSESRFRVLELELSSVASSAEPRPATARWLTPSLAELGRKVGCFQLPNANFEAIARLPSGGLLLGAERQPRGLLELDADLSLTSARAWAMPESRYPSPRNRAPDFADLTVINGRVFALMRNAHLIVALAREANGWREGAAFSYSRTENDPELAYADVRFGKAEGLAIGDDEIFVLLDNNAEPRRGDAEDRRPLLFTFERPPAL